jgi:CRP-like cAMP-binding protein/Fe-S-cluster-containing hydrogenase component 2/thioredoxin reductase
MPERITIAVIGAGPAGLSAAAHAAELGIPHVLLESSAAHANTIQRYQKGKHVMAEPAVLPLRSPLPFEAGTRETVLARWREGLTRHRVNIRHGAEVTRISGAQPDFTITLKDGSSLAAEAIVFAIGVQGNPRLLGVPGDDQPCVQYTLDDPDEYRGEAIVVVGAGDAAIENALALTRQNQVFIINRTDEFTRVKEGNLNAVTKAIDDGRLVCYYRAQCARVEAGSDGSQPWTLVLATDQGEARIACHRIIARIGATPPRKLVESCGIAFANADPAALPVLSTRYESSVKGLYVIGALGGYPLIKQAMNQGYEVVETILGRAVVPADEPLLAERFGVLPFGLGVDATLALMQERIPLFRAVNSLMFRELVLGSRVSVPAAGSVIFRKNDYTNSFYTILAGHAEVALGDDSAQRYRLGTGEFFGEMGLLSGRRRTATIYAGPGCVLIETPRREINKLIKSDDSVRRVIDEHFIVRAIQSGFAPDASFEELRDVARGAALKRYRPDEALFHEGDEADCLHLIRSGSVAVSRAIGGRDVVTSYVAAGNYLGEMGLMGRTRRSATARAAVATETVTLDAASFNQLLGKNPRLREQVQDIVRKRLAANASMAAQPQAGDLISFFMQQGLGEATDVLLIDETLCIGCDNCEKACAETHGGTSRLDREAGPSFAQVHVPTSCRHCENPQCMTDCPPDAIRRAANGEVYILDSCIGCGNCERNCPYGVIQMAAPAPAKHGLMSWLLFGAGPGPGGSAAAPVDKDAAKKAVKCDMCKDLGGGPACVRACPTGAAIRISPDQFVELATRGSAG